MASQVSIYRITYMKTLCLGWAGLCLCLLKVWESSKSTSAHKWTSKTYFYNIFSNAANDFLKAFQIEKLRVAWVGLGWAGPG